MAKVYYVGSDVLGHDGVDVAGHTFVRGGDGVDVDDALAKELLKQDAFQKTAPTRQSQPTKDKE